MNLSQAEMDNFRYGTNGDVEEPEDAEILCDQCGELDHEGNCEGDE